MPALRFLAPALLALGICAAPLTASAQSFSDTQRGDIETIVRNYLIAHPEVLEEAMNELSKRQAAAEAEKHEQSVAKNADTIFNSPRGVMIGNKDGDVTFVEFFDYNCGYCKRAMSDMLDLMKSDPKLKVVLKEFPVLSQGSVEAAQVAVAVRMQDPTGKKYLEFHQKLLGGRGAADKARALAVAKDVGLDIAKLEKDMASPEVKATIEENFRLAESMGMNGTPSYVIGKQVVIGAVGVDGLKEKIGIARWQGDLLSVDSAHFVRQYPVVRQDPAAWQPDFFVAAPNHVRAGCNQGPSPTMEAARCPWPRQPLATTSRS